MKLRSVVRTLLPAIVLLLLASGACHALDQEAIAWIAAHATPLDTVEPGSGVADLQPLRSALSSARVVGIGEGTHGTREFFTLRHRLIEFLATNLSFRAFAFEFPYGEGRLIDRYIKSGEGSPVDILARVYCTPWNHQEMLDTIEWMRQHNEGRAEGQQIGFYGVDIHDGDSSLLIDRILSFIEFVAPEKLAEYEVRLDPFRFRTMYHAALFLDSEGAVRDGLEWVRDDLDSNAAAYAAADVDGDYHEIVHEAELLLQRANVFALSAINANDGGLLRDVYMADNVLWLLNRLPGGSKIAFSGHNYHVGRFKNLTTLSAGETVALTSAGYRLGQRLGSNYVVLGTTTKSGEVAIFPFPGGEKDQVAVMAVPRVGYDGHTTLFRASGIPDFVLDLRLGQEDEPGVGWMYEEDPFLHIGTTFYTMIKDSFRVFTPLRPCFDLIGYIETTSAPTMLPWIPKDDLE